MTTKLKGWFYCLFTCRANSSKSPLRYWGSTRFTLQAAVSFWYQGILSFILGADGSLVSHTSPLPVAAFLTHIPTLSLRRVNSSPTLPTASPRTRPRHLLGRLPLPRRGPAPSHTHILEDQQSHRPPAETQQPRRHPAPVAERHSRPLVSLSVQVQGWWEVPDSGVCEVLVIRLREPRGRSYHTAFPQH